MAFDEGLAQRIREALPADAVMLERTMFGGLAFMLNGNMALGVLGEALMARVGPAGYEAALRLPGARVMDFTGKPMKGYVMVAAEGVADDAALADWVARALAFAGSLPRK